MCPNSGTVYENALLLQNPISVLRWSLFGGVRKGEKEGKKNFIHCFPNIPSLTPKKKPEGGSMLFQPTLGRQEAWGALSCSYTVQKIHVLSFLKAERLTLVLTSAQKEM